MKNGRKKIEGFIIRENIIDKQGEKFSSESIKKMKDQIKPNDPIFKEFDLTQPPAGYVESIEYVEGEGIKISGMIDESVSDNHMFTISGYINDYETKNGYRLIKDVDFVEVSVIPKNMSPYKNEKL